MKKLAFALAIVAATACAQSPRNEGPLTPPPVHGPRGVDDIVGIWRNVHQGVFEVRQDGTYVLISPITEPEAGRYQLIDDRVTLRGEKGCGAAEATYDVRVTRAQRMDLSADRDPCTARRRVLTGDPWIYTPR